MSMDETNLHALSSSHFMKRCRATFVFQQSCDQLSDECDLVLHSSKVHWCAAKNVLGQQQAWTATVYQHVDNGEMSTHDSMV